MPWLITWEATDPHLLPEKRIAYALDGRTGLKEVQAIVEALYASHRYSEADIVHFCAASGRNPYPSTLDDIGGIPFRGQITCGHNPFLLARMVDKLKADEDGSVTWLDRLKPAVRARKAFPNVPPS